MIDATLRQEIADLEQQSPDSRDYKNEDVLGYLREIAELRDQARPAHGAPQGQEAAPIGWADRRVDNGEYGSWLHKSKEAAVRHGAGNGPTAPKYEPVPVYAAPVAGEAAQPVDDARDAARYRWILDHPENVEWGDFYDRTSLGPTATISDAIDAAMSQQAQNSDKDGAADAGDQ